MSLKWPALVVTGLLAQSAVADEVDPCTTFKWNVSHELAVMKQTPQPVRAATKPGKDVPKLQLDKPYQLELSSQSGLTFAVPPGKPTSADDAQGGLVRFHTATAGRYRVALTSRHWIDVVDGKQIIKSRDFQGAPGCERPHKIVEYELPADRDLTLQVSGAPQSSIVLSVTAVASS